MVCSFAFRKKTSRIPFFLYRNWFNLLLPLVLAISQTMFNFEGNFYKPSAGLEMGNPLSLMLRDIYMHYYEISLSEKCPSFFWLRYADSIFTLIGSSGTLVSHICCMFTMLVLVTLLYRNWLLFTLLLIARLIVVQISKHYFQKFNSLTPSLSPEDLTIHSWFRFVKIKIKMFKLSISFPLTSALLFSFTLLSALNFKKSWEILIFMQFLLP